MKKTLAIVLALAMVLCMIPAAFAAQTKTITDKSYTINVTSFGPMAAGATAATASDKAVNSLTFKYNFEEEKEDVTGKFTEDKKMALVTITGFDADLLKADKVAVTVDGKDLQVNKGADYASDVDIYDPWTQKKVVFPVELTKAGYSDTYLVTVKATVKDVEITETAKISLTLKNTADYKPAKDAHVTAVRSSRKSMDAYIVGSKLYLDFAGKYSDWDTPAAESLEITFSDENNAAFKAVTWAYSAKDADGTEQLQTLKKKEGDLVDGVKLDKSAANYRIASIKNINGKKITFGLETASGLYETKAYTVVVRDNIAEADPKGIYFAESTKTIKVTESYAPVVMGVATGKKVDAELAQGKDAAGNINNVIDVDGDKVIGTREGVAYITASYTTNEGKTYTSSSMKIIVAGEAEAAPAGTTTYYVTCRNLNVRKGAGTSYAKAGMLHRGDKVEVVSISKNWAKLANGTYVSAKYIAK